MFMKPFAMAPDARQSFEHSYPGFDLAKALAQYGVCQDCWDLPEGERQKRIRRSMDQIKNEMLLEALSRAGAPGPKKG